MLEIVQEEFKGWKRKWIGKVSGNKKIYFVIIFFVAQSKQDHSRQLRRNRDECLDKIADYHRKVDRYTNQMSKSTASIAILT